MDLSHVSYLVYLFLYKNIGSLLFILTLIYILVRYGMSVVGILLCCYLGHFFFLMSTADFSLYELHGKKKKSKSPCDIYTYWHSHDMPYTVKKCIRSWRRLCPTYTIHIITKKNLERYAPGITQHKHIPSPAFLSDMIRLHVLSERGGIWMDASVYLNDNLDWVHGYQTSTDCEFIGYDQKPWNTYKKVESWFFACIPHSTFVHDWKTEFYRIQTYPSIASYIRRAETKGVALNHLSNKEYLSVYVASDTLLQKPHTYQLQVLDGNGPLSLRCMFLYPFYPLFYREPVVKYISSTRTMMDRMKML